jgi:hypothetical protein
MSFFLQDSWFELLPELFAEDFLLKKFASCKKIVQIAAMLVRIIKEVKRSNNSFNAQSGNTFMLISYE